MEEGDTRSGRQFHLQHLVGQGAFGEVYLAEQDSGAGFRRKVAIKLLHSDVAQMSRDAGRRMRDEARILGRLSHRNIVTVLDLVKLGDRWAVIMDYVPGADLEEVLHALEAADETFPAPAAIEVGAAVLNALDAAFRSDDGQGGELGVIHRDIKPSNVRLTTDGEVKVLDFGVARVNMDTREAQTRATGWIGTERYMAPERILCEGDGPEGDVYAAAATVVELLLRRPLGRTPVREETHGPFVDEALEACRPVLDGADEVVDEILDRLRLALHALPDQRPSPRELSDALARLARQLTGETVLEFSRRFLPRVDELLERTVEPVKGTLSEHTSAGGESPGGPTLAPMGSEVRDDGALTFNPDFDLAPEPTQEDEGPNRTVLLGGGAALLAAGTVFGVLAVGVIGAFAFGGFGGTATPEKAPVPVATEPTPAPSPTPVVPDAPEPPAPEPTPAPEEQPAPDPAPAPTTAPAPQPVPTPAPVAEPEPAPTGPPVDKAQVVLTDASSVTVRCGGVTGSGTQSAVIRNFPAGGCTVETVYLNQTYTTQVDIERKRTVSCSVDGGTLSCN